MFKSCEQKEESLKSLFSACLTMEDKYHKIIEMGRQRYVYDPLNKVEACLVKGCQSTMYLHCVVKDACLFFTAESDALISAGLASLLIHVYSGENPEVILKYPPKFLEDIGIASALTPSRVNGLYNIHLRMKQDALKAILAKTQK